ncbi:DUF6105 family protein [Mesorhizobium xinjiangense]|uniref:DUF6105 family protein n=1 Tax=Mesorhizobium xinjiangense TaxID=2678685 RepID=UPI0012ECF349|nr:DUF6105 family protein [Mesorhizobium xinjiangense]
MRYIVIFWALPLGLFWGWYFLSYHDINFGMLFFSRVLHDEVFRIYGQILGMDPATLPPLVARACIVDTLIISAILAFRRRRAILAWMRNLRARYSGEEAAPSA